MKKIYICSALRGDLSQNIHLARCYCEYVVKEFGFIPIAPHIYFTQFLDDNITKDREFGINAGLSLLSECDELWYFGETISRGMTDEINIAMKQGIPVKYIPLHQYDSYLTERIVNYEID